MDQSHHRNNIFISALFIYSSVSLLIFMFLRNVIVVERFYDSLQFITSFGVGLYILTKGYKKETFSPTFYIGYACILWSLGQLFWFAFVLTGREGLPFPSVAELAFLGSYFFIISAVKDNAFLHRKRMIIAGGLSSLMIIAALVTAIIFEQIRSFAGIYSLFFITTAAIALFLIVSKQGIDILTRCSIILLCITDLILVFQITLSFHSALYLSDVLYPLVFILLIPDAWRKC